jgi:hypothetical protein
MKIKYEKGILPTNQQQQKLWSDTDKKKKLW